MSMIGNLRRATDENIRLLLAQPDLVEEYIYGPEDEQSGISAKLKGLFRKQPQQPNTSGSQPWGELSEDDEIDIDKSWHVIHYLLTDSVEDGEEPGNFLAAGGTEIGDFDVGYGPARAFDSTKTAAIAQFLSQISPHDLKAKFNIDKMQELEIYGAPEEDDAEEIDYFLEYFDDLKDFVQVAAKEGKGLVVWLN